MSFSDRLTRLQQVNAGQLAGLISDFKTEVAKSSLPLPELDKIESRLKNLTLAPAQTGVWSLISRSVTVAESDIYKHFLQAKEQQIDRASYASFTCQKESLRYLVANNDLARFARYFRAIYLPGKGITDRQKEDQALQEAINDIAQSFSTCRWIQRVKEDYDWPCSLVPVLELAPFPKYLDLKDCDVPSTKAVIDTHLRHGYMSLKIALNDTQQELIRLVKEGAFTHALELDLRQCQTLEWSVIHPFLSKIERLQSLLLPMTMTVPEVLAWDASWKEPLKSSVKDTLERIQVKARAENDFTYITNLMKGIQGKNSLKSDSRIPVSFLLSRSTLLANLPPLQALSASGIQSVKAKDIVQAKFRDNEMSIGLCYCPNITKEDLALLFNTFTVKQLYLRGCSQVDDSFLAALPKSYDLISLRIDATSVTQETFASLRFKFPAAQIYWDKHYLKNRAKIADSFGMDRHNLSDNALEAIKHLKYTGYFPMISLETAMELIESDCKILSQPEVIQKLKEFCRYILYLNVNRKTVCSLFLFAEKKQEWTLMYICKSFVQTLYCPDIPEQMNELTLEEKTAFSTIAKATIAEEPQLSFTEDILYFHFIPDHVRFLAPSAPLYQQVQNDDIVNFCQRFAAADPQKRQHYLTRLCQLFPLSQWLQELAKRPQTILLLATQRVADLRGIPVAAAIDIVRAYGRDKIELVLDCDGVAFRWIMDEINKACITFLDLEACTNLPWKLIESHIIVMPNLNFVLLPKTFRLSNLQARPNDEWSKEWHYRLSANIFHNIHQDEPSFAIEAQIERAWYHRLTDTLFQKRPYATHIHNLGYYSKASKEKLQASFADPQIQRIVLFGASNVDDSFFPEVLPQTLKELDLRGTCVSKKKVEALRKAGISVEFDEEHRGAYILWKQVHETNFTKLSQDAFDALSYFNVTGYFPLVTELVAMELITYKDETLPATWRLKLLQEHCLKFLAVQIDRSNVRALYNFSLKINDALLWFLTYYFIEIHYNPYRQSDLSEGEQAFWNFHCRIAPAKFCDKKLEFTFEKKQPLTVTGASQNSSQSVSANFDEKGGAEEQDGL